MTNSEHSLKDASTPPTVELAISGMTCANCARHVREAIQSVPSVQSATVNLEASQAVVRWSPGTATNIPAIFSAIEAAGYGAKAVEAAHDHSQHRLSGWQFNLWIGVLGTVPLMIGEWVFGLEMQTWFRWFSFCTGQHRPDFWPERNFIAEHGDNLKSGSSNMDTLVALGSTTAFGYSLWALFAGGSGHLYFMEAAAIITLITVGHWLEARMSAHASGALKSLLNLAPQTARRRQPDGSEIETSAAELKPDDFVILKPGDRVPTDGEVAEGESAVDESMLTGESLPMDKTAKNNLYAGTVNLNGRLVMRVTATGESTALANINRRRSARADQPRRYPASLAIKSAACSCR